MSTTIKKPLNSLQRIINKNVSVRLKSDYEYRGKAVNIDQYMNVILADADELYNDALVAHYGKVVIRGNNVLFIMIEENLL
ncbi:MAG TPA: LSM domain-containing protein [Nitrososphaerales archaeon]